MNAPVIAVTTWRRSLPTSLGERTDLNTLGTEYTEAVVHAGGIPIMVPGLSVEAARTLVTRVDGLLLSGGQDIGGTDPGDVERDATEWALLQAARENAVPVFGICRGLQMINVFRGGTLVPDLPVTGSHEKAVGEAQLASRHPVDATAPWLVAALPADRTVNSIHHQAVDVLGESLSVVATAPDGVVEALEWSEPGWFLRAVQWHPEKLPGPHGREHARALLREFIEVASRVKRFSSTSREESP